MGLDHFITLVDIRHKTVNKVFEVYKWLYKDNKEEYVFLDWLHKQLLHHLKKAGETQNNISVHITPAVTEWFKHYEPDILREYMFDLLSTIMLFEPKFSVIIFKFNDGDKETIYYFFKGFYVDENGKVYQVNKKKLLKRIYEFKIKRYEEKLNRLKEKYKKLK